VLLLASLDAKNGKQTERLSTQARQADRNTATLLDCFPCSLGSPFQTFVNLLFRLAKAHYLSAYPLERWIESVTQEITTTTISNISNCAAQVRRVMAADSEGPWFEPWPGDGLFLVIFLSLHRIHQIRPRLYLPKYISFHHLPIAL
jgi:hypothetical protein